MRAERAGVRVGSIGIIAAALPTLAGLSGCWSSHAGNPSRLTLEGGSIPPDAWPTRDTTCLRELLEATPAEVFTYRLLGERPDGLLSAEDLAEVSEPLATITDTGIFGNALVRMYEMNDAEAALRELKAMGFAPNGRVLTCRGWNDEEAAAGRARAAWARERFNARHGPALGVALCAEADESGLWAGVPIRIPDPGTGEPPRGVVLHLHSIAPNEHESAVMTEFAARGWLVVDVSTFATVRAPVRAGADEALQRVEQASKEMEARLIDEVDPLPLRSYSLRQIDHPAAERLRQLRREERLLRERTFQLGPDVGPDDLGRQVATEVDQQLAGNAYVGEAALAFLYDRRPELKALPLAIVGFSGGALAAPALAARLEDCVDAVILIGGGADLYQLTRESILTDGGITIRRGDSAVDRRTNEAIHAAYLRHTRLDPWVVAPTLARVPVLTVYGTWDRIVPTSAARKLNERLSGPDRLVLCGGGHLVLFYRVPGRAGDLADWLDRAVRRRP